VGCSFPCIDRHRSIWGTAQTWRTALIDATGITPRKFKD
jgi:hypothetical protein